MELTGYQAELCGLNWVCGVEVVVCLYIYIFGCLVS